MKFRLFAFLASLTLAAANSFAATWQPSAGHTQIPIWPGSVPDAKSATNPETANQVTKELVAGKPWVEIKNVSNPTMTVYSPKGKNTGVAIVVFPGGGFQVLAIDLEGTEVCRWLAAHGITGILLKYRVPHSGEYWDPQLRHHVIPKVFTALQDAQRTIGLVRRHAEQWHINPHKIGVMGFSAGGYMVAAISTHFQHRLYPVVDAADKLSCRPDFAAALYPGHLHRWVSGRPLGLNPFIAKHINTDTPPTFLVQAEDDHVDSVNDALSYYIGLKDAHVPVEMHLYAHGGHAFGLRPTQLPITRWPNLFEAWLKTIGMLPRQ